MLDLSQVLMLSKDYDFETCFFCPIYNLVFNMIHKVCSVTDNNHSCLPVTTTYNFISLFKKTPKQHSLCLNCVTFHLPVRQVSSYRSYIELLIFISDVYNKMKHQLLSQCNH